MDSPKKIALYLLRDMKREIEETGLLQPVEDTLITKIESIKTLDDTDNGFIESLIFLGVRGVVLSNAEVLFWQLGAGESLEQILRYNKRCAFAYISGYNMYCKYVADLYQLAIQCGKSSSMMNLYKAEMNGANRYLRSLNDLIASKRATKSEIIDGISDDEW